MFNTNIAFLKHKKVYIPVLVIFYIAIFSVTTITKNLISDKNLFLDFSHTGYKNFLDYYTFPLGTLSTAVLYLGFMLTIYRSDQNKIQIEQTEKNNTANLYINHRKMFIESFSNINTEIISLPYNRIYKTFFPNNNLTKEICTDFTGLFNDEQLELLELLFSFIRKIDTTEDSDSIGDQIIYRLGKLESLLIETKSDIIKDLERKFYERKENENLLTFNSFLKENKKEILNELYKLYSELNKAYFVIEDFLNTIPIKRSLSDTQLVIKNDIEIAFISLQEKTTIEELAYKIKKGAENLAKNIR
jgi:hypothetical protein